MSPPHPDVGTRILFFADASSVHTRRWVAAVAERGAEAIVITRQPAEVPGAKEVIAIAPGTDKLTWFKALPEVRRVAREVAARFQPTLVHGHYVTSYGLWAAMCGLKLPTVLTAWGSDILVTPRDSRLMRRPTPPTSTSSACAAGSPTTTSTPSWMALRASWPSARRPMRACTCLAAAA